MGVHVDETGHQCRVAKINGGRLRRLAQPVRGSARRDDPIFNHEGWPVHRFRCHGIHELACGEIEGLGCGRQGKQRHGRAG